MDPKEPATANAASSCTCYECWRTGKSEASSSGNFLGVRMHSFIVCEICGNKRCPHATNHALPCTNSNVPGQPGSRYSVP